MKRIGFFFGFILLPTKVEANSFEILVGQKSTTLDVQVLDSLGGKLGYFSRTRFTKPYDGNINAFGALDLTYSLGKGVDLLLETQFAPGMGIVPKPGIQYIRTMKDLTVVGLLTGSWNLNLEPHFVLRYQPKIKKNVSLMGQVELLTNFGMKHNFSVQRFRGGVSIEEYTLGIAGDLLESQSLDYNLGGFLEKKF